MTGDGLAINWFYVLLQDTALWTVTLNKSVTRTSAIMPPPPNGWRHYVILLSDVCLSEN